MGISIIFPRLLYLTEESYSFSCFTLLFSFLSRCLKKLLGPEERNPIRLYSLYLTLPLSRADCFKNKRRKIEDLFLYLFFLDKASKALSRRVTIRTRSSASASASEQARNKRKESDRLELA